MCWEGQVFQLVRQVDTPEGWEGVSSVSPCRGGGPSLQPQCPQTVGSRDQEAPVATS